MKNNLSIVIPVYNESKNLDNLFNKLSVFDRKKADILFVDGGSSDGSFDRIQAAGFEVIRSEKGRGKQLHRGAEASQGDRLLFLHADTYFRQSPQAEIEKVLAHHDMGAFTIRFQTKNPVLKAIEWGSNWRVDHRNIAFGDQGMFMTRHFYERVGGFRPLDLMEDYDFSLRVKKAGHPIYRSPQEIFASSRRFDQRGSLKMLWTMQRCQAMFRRGEDIDKIKRLYNRS